MLAYFLPLLIYAEVFAMGGAAIGLVFMFVSLPDDQYVLIGGGGGVIFCALLCSMYDIIVVGRARALERRRSTSAEL
jgi:hypothetical protein